MNRRYELVAARAAHRCEYCRAPEVISNSTFEVEHIVPTSKSGEDEGENWALSCRACNARKSNALDGRDPITNTVSRLFHPRRDIWHEHFELVPELGALRGLTVVGRATIARLVMNSTWQMQARQHWQRLDLFP